MFDWLAYDFMQRALVASSILSISIAPVGVFLVLRRLSLAGEAMAHAIVPGIVIAFVAAAILTPPDVVSQLLLALPIIALYEVSIIGAKIIAPKDLNEATE